MESKTLEALGPNLPVLPPKFTSREFAFRPWTMKEEKEVARLRKGAKRSGVFVREVFDLMLTQLDGKDWQAWRAADPKKERMLVLNQMPYGNILYMYLWLRFEAMGHELRVNGLECPHCGAKKDEFVADLRTLDVDVRSDEEPAESCHELRKPLAFGDVKVTGIWLRDTPWDVMERATPSQAESGETKYAFIQSSSIAARTDVEDRAALAMPTLVQRLSKLEMEELYGAVEVHNGGPVMAVELTCDECDRDYFRPLNWNYDHFFGSSSLPKRRSASGRSSSSSATESLG